MTAALGRPRLHFRSTTSTNDRARELAAAGAPHGTLVTAGAQLAGRGRQGRVWSAPAGRALLCSLVIRQPPELLSLAAGVAVAEVVEAAAGVAVAEVVEAATAEDAGAEVAIKWPNDVLLDGRKVAGILVEGRPQEDWAVLGIGLNVAVRTADLPVELREHAGSLGLEPGSVESVLGQLLERLRHWLGASSEQIVAAVAARDALLGAPVSWNGGSGRGAGVDAAGRLLVDSDGAIVALDAGEIHLGMRGEAPGSGPEPLAPPPASN